MQSAKLSEDRILEDVVKIPWVLWLWLTRLNHLLWVKGPVLDGLNAPSLVLSEAVFAEGVSMQLAAEGALVMLREHGGRGFITTVGLQCQSSCANCEHSCGSPRCPFCAKG